MIERGYEGYVAKDETSPYEGGPTRRWLKVKQRRWTDEENRWQRTIFRRVDDDSGSSEKLRWFGARS